MTTNPSLAVWAAIVAQPILGRTGNTQTYPAGPAHPTGHAPAWVTAHGCDLALLHAAHCASVVHDRRGEDRECHASAATRKRTRRPKLAKVLTLARRTA